MWNTHAVLMVEHCGTSVRKHPVPHTADGSQLNIPTYFYHLSTERTDPCWLQRPDGKLPTPCGQHGKTERREGREAGLESFPVSSG